MGINTKGWEQVGVIGVDAGLCWIGDPCYILHKSDQVSADLGKDWSDFCSKLYVEGDGFTAHQFNYDFGHAGLGVVVPTGYGDGTYPVLIKKNADGRVVAVMVDFDGGEE